MKGRALRRALATNDAYRVGGKDVPLITTTTEWITPTEAYAMLEHNQNNRPISWPAVEADAAKMRKGEWVLHSQGIDLDKDGNILNGQRRLWAVIYAGVGVHLRVSRGNPREAARLIDRGTPQSARDLATRATGRKHSPTESSLARVALALAGQLRPDTDALAMEIERQSDAVKAALYATSGTRKTKAVLMVLGVIFVDVPVEARGRLYPHVAMLADALTDRLAPHRVDQCWGRGAAFALALEQARQIVRVHRTAPPTKGG